MNLSRKEERITYFLQRLSADKEKFTDETIILKDGINNNSVQHIPARGAMNTPQEAFFLSCAKDLQLKHPRHLFLTARNEYGIDKLVFTTLRPTLATYPDIGGYDTLESCAAFVANFLQYERLADPLKLPVFLPSSKQILNWSGAADCFDYSTFLVSLLLGSGYDAYVVQGYALRTTCERDLSSVVCPRHVYDPYFGENFDEQTSAASVLSPAAEQKRDDDALTSFIHCWVYVSLHRSHRGKKDTYDGPVFIEPTTGEIYLILNAQNIPYTRVETIWNGRNHWINLQVETPLLKMNFDFSKEEMWLPVFNPVKIKNGYWEVPTSWAEKITITESLARLKYLPDGERVLLFYKSKVELLADSCHPEGLISRVSSFHDIERTDLICCKEFYTKKKRRDHLLMRMREPQKIQELFAPCPKSGVYKYIEIPAKFWAVHYTADYRSDGLVKQEETFGELITQDYSNNVDGRIKRAVMIKRLHDSESMIRLPRRLNGEVTVLTVM